MEAVTPERLVFEKPVEFVKLRTESGDIGILAKHINYITAIGVRDACTWKGQGRCDILSGRWILEVRQDKVVILGVNIVETTKAEAEKNGKTSCYWKGKKSKVKRRSRYFRNKKRIQSNLSKK